MTFIKEATKKTLNISFLNKEIKVEGSSITENPHTFFDEVSAYLDTFDQKNNHFNYEKFSIKITYINTSSLKLFMQLVKRIHSIDPSIEIIWLHDQEDEDMMEIGQMFAAMLGIDIKTDSY